MTAMKLHEAMLQDQYWQPVREEDQRLGFIGVIDTIASRKLCAGIITKWNELCVRGAAAEIQDGVLLPPSGLLMQSVVDIRYKRPLNEAEEPLAVPLDEFDARGSEMLAQDLTLAEPIFAEARREGETFVLSRSVSYGVRSRLGRRFVDVMPWNIAEGNPPAVAPAVRPPEHGFAYTGMQFGAQMDARTIQAKVLRVLPVGAKGALA